MNGAELVTFQLRTRITDPATLALLEREISEIAENAVNPQPATQSVAEPPIQLEQVQKPKLPRYVLQRTRNARLRDWLLAQATQPRRIVRWLAWWIALPWKAASFVKVVTSGPVQARVTEDGFTPAEAVIVERDNACADCSERYIFIRLNGETSEHCAACKCPPSSWSENAYRNTLGGWHCPLRKHPGPYPNDGQAGALKGLGYEESAVLSAVGGGCTGCGCGKKSQ